MSDLELLKKLIADFPQSCGVYLMKNAKTKVIYVGKAKNLRARVRSYFHESHDKSVKTRFLVSHIESIEYILTKTEVEAFLLEASLIKKLKPRYNVRLKDDKSYPYIRCSLKDEFPRFYLARRVQNDGAIYFGPYLSGLAVRETIRFLNRTFKIRDCSDAFLSGRTRPCMTHQIGRCTAPCVGLVDKTQYAADVRSALEFLKGHDDRVVKDLTKRMKEAASLERFEAAAKYRDSLHAVQQIWQRQSVVHPNRQLDQDVVAYIGDEAGTLIQIMAIRAGRLIGSQSHFLPRLNPQAEGEDVRDWLLSFLNQYYAENFIPDEILVQDELGPELSKLFQAVLRERGKESRLLLATGEEGRRVMDLALEAAGTKLKDFVAEKEKKGKGLEEIQSKLNLPKLPQRIECFDISNFQGDQSVASQVVFEEGIPKKEDYRLYKIKTVKGSNDFASMKEVLSRRFKHDEYEDPQLVVVDGGKGQLKMAVTALLELGKSHIPVVGLAKARTLGEFSDQEVGTSDERFFLPGRQNPVRFSSHSEAYRILVGLRDEAHRFAITFHRKLRGQATLESELDAISGLGEKRKKILLKHFGSIAEIKRATVEELAELPTFHRVLAERVHLHLSDVKSEPE